MVLRTRRSTLFPYTTLFRSGAGPVKVITDKGVLEADPATGEMVLAAHYPGVTADDVQAGVGWPLARRERLGSRSEEHTSELQSRFDLVCRLLLEKKKKYEHR